MKAKNKILILLFTFMMICVAFHENNTAYAGELSSCMMDNDMLFNTVDGNISIREWIIGNGINMKELDSDTKSVNFSPMSDNGDVLLLRAYPNITPKQTPALQIETEFIINKIEGNKKFAIMIGAQNLSDIPTATGSGSIWFAKNGDIINYGVDNYIEENENPTLFSGSITDNKIKVNVNQFSNNDIEIFINDEKVLIDHNFPIGLIGYGQFGDYTDSTNYIDIDILEVKVNNYYYSTPPNTNVLLDFESDKVNANEWRVEGNVLFDNGVMSFEDAGTSTFIISKYRYSNFEMTFDIPYIKRHPDFNEDGELIRSASDSIYILCGVQASNAEDIDSYVDAYTHGKGINFRCTGDAADNNGYPASSMRLELGKRDEAVTKQVNDDTGYNIWNPIYDGRVVNIKIKVIDGVYSVDIKWEDENKYTNLFTKDYGAVEDGYIMFSAGWNTSGPNTTNISFDNIKIVNLDNSPNLVKSDFIPSGIINNGDYPFVDNRNPNDLVSQINVQNVEYGKIITIALLFILTIVGVVVSIILLKKRGK